MNQPIDSDMLSRGLRSAVMTMRIIVVAMAAGATMMLIAMTVICENSLAMPDLGDPLVWIPVALAVPMIAASGVVPPIVRGQMRARLAAGTLNLPAGTCTPQGDCSPLSELGDAGKLAMIYQSGLIVGCALLEGAAMFCAVSILVFNSGLVGLGLGLLLVALVVLRFPSPRGLASWIADELKAMDAERELTR